MGSICLTKKELANVVGYAYNRLHEIDAGLPENEKLFVKSEDGKYDLALFVQRWIKYKENDTRHLTKKELASVAGYSYRRLHDIDTGLPENGKLYVKCEDSKYDLALFVQRWVKYNLDHETSDDRTLDDVKAEHEVVKIRKTELEVARLEGKLVDVQEIRRLWGGVANTVTQNMIHLPSKVAPRLIMVNNIEVISDIIDAEIRDALNQIADTPLPIEAAAESEYDEEESR